MSILNVNKINPVGGGSTVTITGIASVTGNVTATGTITGEHHGDASNLTGLPAANLTGTLPAISGANLTNITASSLSGNSSINTSGIITATSFVPTTGQLSHRNLAINGAMTVAQRGSSSTATSGYHTVDRWEQNHGSTDEAPTFSTFEVSAPGQYHLPTTGPHPYKEGFRQAWGVTNGNQTSGAGADDNIIMGYVFEAQDIANSGWDYTNPNSFITLSFWIKSSVAQEFYGQLLTQDGSVYNYPFGTGSLTAFTWKKVVKTIPGNANITFNNDNGAGLRFYLWAFAGTNLTGSVTQDAWGAVNWSTRVPDNTTTWYTTNDASLQITGFQLEVGPVATPFEHLPFAENKRRCYRYCQRGRHISSCLVGTPGTYYFTRGNIPLFTPMRSTVTGTLKAATWNSNRYFQYMTWSSGTNVTAAPASTTFNSGSISGVPDVLSVHVNINISSGSSNSPLPANGPGSNNVYPIEYYDVLLEAEL